MLRRLATIRFATATATLGLALVASSCATRGDKLVISAADQKMVVYRDGKPVRSYPVSTSKFGLGDRRGSNRTPIGRMEVAEKVGGGAPKGTVFKSRRPTGEVVKPNSPGRDPIVTRILWLRGKEGSTKNAYGRCIYIHGTPEERKIGLPASYGCIRMKSNDIVDLYRMVDVGAEVEVTTKPLSPRKLPAAPPQPPAPRPPATAPSNLPPQMLPPLRPYPPNPYLVSGQRPPPRPTGGS